MTNLKDRLTTFFVVSALGAFSTGAWASSQAVDNTVLDPTAMDTSINPCQDFYQYSCGSWLSRTTIPSDKSEWGRSFSVISEENLKTLNSILSDYSNGQMTPDVPYARKLGDYYASCMDEATIERTSAATLQSALSEIDLLKTRKDLAPMVAKLQLEGVNVLFSFGATPDLKDPTLMISELDQGGYGLPSSNYYTSTDDSMIKLRQAYQEHITRIFNLAGYSSADAAQAAAQVMSVETTLTRQALPPEDLHDPTTLYHPGDLTALEGYAPSFDWNKYFAGLGIPTPKVINVSEPKFTAAFDAVAQNTDLATLRTYLKWEVMNAMGSFLGKDIYAEMFHFDGTILSGIKTPAPRWKKCVGSVSGGIGEALGHAFVEKAFSPEAKKRALEMIQYLKEAFNQDLKTLDWLDATTREAAIEKLGLLSEKIGYPDHWHRYDNLSISRGSYWGNAKAAAIFSSRRQLSKIGGKVDRTEWGMSPQTVNAYYDPNTNSINFPAAILQPPFFSESANDASNFGAIGMVIGHEMTHGFDTSGSKFNGYGAEEDWWSPSVRKLFDQKASCLENEYSKFEALPGLNVNGKLTITENIADNGGLKLSYAAFKLARAGKPPLPSVAGLNEDQQFFVSMAQMWCDKQTDEALREQVLTDPHSPARFRVIGTVTNDPDFARAFGCQIGTPMAPKDRCGIW